MTILEYRCSVHGSALAVDRVLPKTYLPQWLRISFRRTIRVPDNKELSKLPPDLGGFQLHKVQDYTERLPRNLVEKGGVFFPMYQREAMWIDFKANVPFMIKIYCGGVNVVSGEHASEGTETKQRRAKLLEQGKPIQDYVVVPEQRWLDGVAIQPSVVRQFVAMPIGQGYTVEAQLTGKEVVGGLTFEITPAFCEPKEEGPMEIHVKLLTSRTIAMRCSPDDELTTIKRRLYDMGGFPPDQQRLIYGGMSLDNDEKTLSSYKIKEGATLHMVLRLRGGNPTSRPSELGIAAGGMIKQNVRRDTHDPSEWAKGFIIPFRVQILDSSTFRQVTGHEPPACPIDAATYAEAGLPFFDLYEENPTDVSGAEAFGALQSVTEIDMARGQSDGPEPAVHPPVISLRGSSLGTTIWNDGDTFRVEDPDGLLSPGGPRRDFRTLADLEAEIRDSKLDD